MRLLSVQITIAFLALTGCGSDEPESTSSEFSNNPAFIRVADRIFVSPVGEIAQITRPGDENDVSYAPLDEDVGMRQSERLARNASRRSQPIDAGHFNVTPGRSYDFHCPRLAISWVCSANDRGVRDDLPNSFSITDRRYLKQFDAYTTVGGERVSDHLRAIEPITAAPRIVCDKASKFCTAAALLSSRVIVVWDVWPNDRPGETAAEMAKRQGRAVAMVANGS